MFSKLALAATMLFAINAFAAEKIECSLEGKKPVQATIIAKGQSRGQRVYEITADEKITSAFFTLEDRGMIQTKSAKADILEDFDGNSGVKISFRKDFLQEKAGATSRAYLRTYYDDIEHDDVSQVMTCTIVL